MSKWTQRVAMLTAGLLAVVGGSFVPTRGSTAGATIKSINPAGGGVPTTRTDPSKFKNCQEPPADALWQRAKADEVGLDAAKLQAAADYYRDQLQATMRVYRFNCLVQTGTFDPVMERFLSHMFSTTKPTMTLVAGVAIRKGLLRVDDTIGKFFPDRGDEAHRAITVKQLLNHLSGNEMHWATELDDGLPDAVDTFMSLKITHQPGTWFDYSQTGCNMLSAVIEKAVGEKFQAFAQRELFDKIGILKDNYFWSQDRAGWSYGYSGLYLRPIDMIRLGTLMLQKGVYRGQRLVDEQFIDDMQTGSGANPGFGYNVWINGADHFVSAGINRRRVSHDPIIASAPHDMYFTWGWRGRHIFVVPSLGMVVTVTPFGGQVPCPGAVCTFMNGYPGQGPGSGPDAQLDGNQPSQAEMSKGHHEFFRLLMSAVTDQKVADPGPWDKPDDNSFDPDQFIGNPQGQMNSAGIGRKMENYPAYFSNYAAVPGIFAKNMSTK